MLEGISKKVLKTDDSVKICLWFPKLLLKLVCIWPGKTKKVFLSFAFWLIMADCAFIEYGLYCLITENFKDLNESFTAITLFSTIMQIIIKGSVFYYYRNTARNIFHVILHKFWPSNLLGKEIDDSLYRYNRSFLIGMMPIYVNGLFFVTVLTLTPLLEGGRQTPYKTIYPFDYTSSPQFEIIYLMQFFTNFHVVLGVIVGVDTSFMAICCNITAQYRLLENMFLKFGTDEVKELNVKLSLVCGRPRAIEENISEEKKFLTHCINHHQLLLRTMDDVEKVFSIIAFFQLGFSIISICLSSFILTTQNVGFNQLLNIATFIAGHIIQLFCYCSAATEVDFEMNNLSQYIFSSYWYQTDIVKLKHDITFIIKKSQNVKKITALKLFPINYDTFIQVLRISFSFHTVLSSIASK